MNGRDARSPSGRARCPHRAADNATLHVNSMSGDCDLRLHHQLRVAIQPCARVPPAAAGFSGRTPDGERVFSILVQRGGQIGPHRKITVICRTYELAVQVHIADAKQSTQLKKYSLPRSPFPIPRSPRKHNALPIPHLSHRLEAACTTSAVLHPGLLELCVVRQIDNTPSRVVECRRTRIAINLAPMEPPSEVKRDDHPPGGDRPTGLGVYRRRARRPCGKSTKRGCGKCKREKGISHDDYLLNKHILPGVTSRR